MNTNFMSLAAITAISNPLWMSWLPFIWQFIIGGLGGILLVLMILNKYTEWKLNKKKLKE